MKTALLFVALFGWSALLPAADLSKPVILVAKPELREGLYRSSILVVKPLGADQHLGFIVNRPTEVVVGKSSAQHVYLGGPVGSEIIFALVKRAESPGGKSLEVMPGLFVSIDSAIVDKVIESEPAQARVVAGLVAWQAGELEDEIEQGAWYVLEGDAALAMRDPEGLWEELVRRSQRSANTI